MVGLVPELQFRSSSLQKARYAGNPATGVNSRSRKQQIMYLNNSRVLKGSFALAASVVFSGLASAQTASVTVNEEAVAAYGFDAGDWNQVSSTTTSVTPNSDLTVIANGAQGGAQSDLSTHTISAYGNSSTTYNFAANAEDTAFGSTARMTDTAIFGTSGVVNFGINPTFAMFGGGNDEASVQISYSILDSSNNFVAGAFDSGTLYTYYNSETFFTYTDDNAGYSQTATWNPNLSVNFNEVAGEKYTISMTASSNVVQYQGYVPPGQNNFGVAYAGVDPTWYLNTGPGNTVTTDSGYAIHPQAVPEPTSLVGFGVACIGLFARRRRR